MNLYKNKCGQKVDMHKRRPPEDRGDTSTSQGMIKIADKLLQAKRQKGICPWHLLGECGPVNVLILDLWPPEL